MKVFGGALGGEKNPKGGRLPDDLKQPGLRYALGLPHVSVVVLGMHDEEELRQNLGWVREFKALSPAELQQLDKSTRTLATQWKELYGPVV
jgi:predicted aldo/keto reductase-like oxidoreductase